MSRHRRARKWLALAMAVLACGAPERPEGSPDVVIVVLDTTRVDHLSAYGYTRETSPFLARLATRSRVYTNAYSSSTWTRPAHASLFTGLSPTAHGVTWRNPVLAERHATLAEHLARGGYRTAAFTENHEPGLVGLLRRGFQEFREIDRAREPDASVEAFARFVNAGGDAPLFAFVNLNGPHQPYDSARQFHARFLSDPAYAARALGGSALDFLEGKLALDPKTRTHMVEHYDAELRHVDHVVEQLVRLLEERGSLDRTILIVLSDHGENLGDHQLLGHQFGLYETTVRIPLLVHYPPAFPPGSIDEHPVQITDVLPTILELVGLDDPEPVTEGRSLLPGHTDERRAIVTTLAPHAGFDDPEQRTRFASERLRMHRRDLQTIRMGPMKLHRGSDDSHELYDLSKDPEEQDDLSRTPEHAATRDTLLRALDDALRASAALAEPSHAPSEISEEERARLEALGYL